jgi:regulator of PEP synthase PpsR (kinase-PPPase family)
MHKQTKIVWVVSDGTGRTAAQLIKAASYQFEDADIEYRIITEVTTHEKIQEIVGRVKRETGMIVYTIVSDSNRRLFHRLAVENHILVVDLFGPLIVTMQKFLQKVALEQPGLTQIINRDYYRMVDAVDFTIKHDDGKALSKVGDADIIILGPSRVGKTPLSVYLAYMGWKVANIPVISGRDPFDNIEINPSKVFCLVIEPGFLQKRRVDRIKKLGDPNISGYTEFKSIIEEIEYCKRLSLDGARWPMIDVSYRTIEDIAKEILQHLSV